MPKISAKIIDVKVQEGSLVEQGQEMIILDNSDLQTAYKTAQYSFNTAVYARDALKNSGLADDYSIKQAQQQVNITWEQVQLAKRNLEYAVIKSPVKGVVLALNAKINDYAIPSSMSPIALVAKQEDLIAVLEVNELDISLVKLDQEITLKVDALNNEYEGKLIYIGSKGNDLTGVVNYIVKASISNVEGLKPKMSVDGEINVFTSKDVLLISSLAVREEDDKKYVFIPVYDIGDNIIDVKKQYIELGGDNDSEVEVISGLALDDKIILNYDLNSSSFNFGFGSTN
jgi:RND family efflux transporter MFP subunit